MNDLRDIWLPLADRFYRAAYYLLESQEDAEDAVQELYLKIMKTPGRFADVKEPVAFGMTILKNICIDMIRRRERRKAEELQEYMISETSDPNRRTADRDRLRILLEEIEKLPEKQAAVLKMRTLEGLEYDEISRRTGLSQVNIRVLISMARKTLKKKTGI
jgi:RNA polymerase sigma-70 factor (ECF subfamily)